MAYADLLIRIFRQETGGYPVEITAAGEGEPGRGYLDPATQPPPTEAPFADRAYGQALYEWFFADDRLKRIWARVRGAHLSRRICLRIDDDAAGLHTVPWEALCEPEEGRRPALHLAAASATPFSRYLAVDSPLGEPASDRPIRVLVVAPQQADFEDAYLGRYPGMAMIDPQEEFEALQGALQPAIERGQIEIVLLDPPCSLARIGQELHQGYHGLHLVCHGLYDPQSDRAALLLADADNRVQRETDEEIASVLGQQLIEAGTQLRLVFLASCQSAKRSSADAFRGLAPRLVQAGVPAVVAMQDQVGAETARQFALTFYKGLLRHGQVDLAANEARQTLLAARLPGPIIPVLFLRTKDGRLLAPDPDLTALRDALQETQDDDLYAHVADDRGNYLRLPVELVPLDEHRSQQQATSARGDPTAGIPFVDAVRDTCRDPSSRLVLVTGYYGSNLTTQLKRFAWLETGAALRRLNSAIAAESGLPESGQDPITLPLFASLGELRDGRSRHPADPVLGLVLHRLGDTVWPGLTAHKLESLFTRAGLRLLLILDDDDDLAEREQRDYHFQIVEFAAKPANINHRVILAVRPAFLEPDGPFSKHHVHVLGVQRMERRKVRHYLQLEAQEHEWAQKLLDRIDQAAYFDLVAVPWFLVKLVQQARKGFCPRSRTEVMATIVDDAVDRVVHDLAGIEQGQYLLRPSRQGLEENVRQIVNDLAWQMQSTYQDALPLADTLAAIERHRGRRNYGVEPMYEALVTWRLLARKGSDAVRFAYRGIQGYCCAQAILQQANADRVLDNVMANVGRLTRLRWWEDTVVFACGLMANRPSRLDEFLKVIVYGMDPRDNEQVFLAARCLAESAQASLALAREGEEQVQDNLKKMAEAIAAALSWRLDGRYEPRSAERGRAAELLGQITYPSHARELVHVAYHKSRWDRHNAKAFDHSDVRMAAVVGLLRLPPEDRVKLLKSLDKQGVLATMLEQWTNGQVQELIDLISKGTNVAAQSIAAMALGDLYGRLALSASERDNEMANQALNALTTQFQDPATDEDTMWALAYALAMIDLPTVKRAMVEGGRRPGGGQEGRLSPLSDEKAAAFFQEWSQQAARQKFLAYLIGLSQWRDDRSLAFLREPCLTKNTSQVPLAAVAIDALSRVGRPSEDVPLLEKIALYQWDDVLGLKDLRRVDREYLQRKAIESLASLGDLECLDRLRQQPRTFKWSPDLERTLYVTTERLFWRLQWDRQP